jgi:hypothetical protein
VEARKLVLLFTAIALVAGLAAPTWSPAATARTASVNCDDFSSQAAAQNYFLSHGGPSSDPEGLDADHDGKACESNPCPCSSSGGGGGGGGKPKPHHKKKHKKRPPLEQNARSGRAVYVPTRCFHADGYQPLLIEVNYCGADLGYADVHGITWSSWTVTGASGSGTLLYQYCPDPAMPRCGTYAETPATLTLYRPKFCRNVGRNVFTRIYESAPASYAHFLGYVQTVSCQQL